VGRILPYIVLLAVGASPACSLDREGGGRADAAAVDSGPGCVPSPEECNGEDDDCDGSADEDFDFDSDPRHCGSCNNACPSDPAHASPSCSGGECRLACDAGFDDCDGDLENGCEADLGTAAACGACDVACEDPTPLCEADGDGFTCVDSCSSGRTLCGDSCVDTGSDVSHCGGCGSPCPGPAHGTPGCSGGTCGIDSCDAGWDDCNSTASDGCETPLDTTTDCGACDRTCNPPDATGTCTTGTCAIGACDPLRGDCDSTVSNGCETPLDTLSDCGSCGTGCSLAHATATCAGGSCAIDTCDSGWDDCDGMDSTGCEADLTADGDCGGCGVTCSFPHASATCTATGCALGTCDALWDDCDGDPSNGCETDLTMDGDCGSCRNTCTLDHATSSCSSSGTCEIDSCDSGWRDCDSIASNGCEGEIGSDSHCSMCGAACLSGETCVGGTCSACAPSCSPCTGDCGTGGSSCSCGATCSCSYGCPSDCDVVCSDSTCTVDGVDGNSDLEFRCRMGATCTIDARGESNVEGRCEGVGTSCEVDCRNGPTEDTSNCYLVECRMGAECAIHCGTLDRGSCDFDTCHSDYMDCGAWVTCGMGRCPP